VRINVGTAIGGSDGVAVVYQGILIPFAIFDQGSSNGRVFCRIDIPNGEDTELDIFHGAALVGAFTTPTFNQAGMKLDDTAFDNDHWIWDAYDLYSNPHAPGSWKPCTIGDPIPGGGSYGMRFGGSNPWIEISSVSGELPDDLNGMIVDIPGLTGTGAAALTGLNTYVDVLSGCVDVGIIYRIDGTTFWWGTLQQLSASAQLAADWALQNARHIALMIRGGADCFDTDAVMYVGGEIAVDIAYPPTVSVGSSTTAHYLNGTLTSSTTGESVRLHHVLMPATNLIIDCYQKTQDTQDFSFWYGGANPTDGANWIRLMPGVNTLTLPAGTTAAWAWRERFAI
jgi:hypothetical protein